MKRVKYTTLVRPDTFIGQYMSYMSALDTPSAYDFWSALWLTSLAPEAGELKVHFEKAQARVRPLPEGAVATGFVGTRVPSGRIAELPASRGMCTVTGRG